MIPAWRALASPRPALPPSTHGGDGWLRIRAVHESLVQAGFDGRTGLWLPAVAGDPNVHSHPFGGPRSHRPNATQQTQPRSGGRSTAGRDSDEQS